MAAQWRQLVDRVMAVPEQIYERWNSADGWDNDNVFGREFGENGVSWCVIFDWVMYSRAGLAAIVPRTDNVSSFTDWAQARSQWSEYPSVGAWVNFGDGAHTEIVVGFDADTVYTKGGNSLKAGAADNGQGNGVWSHATARRSSRVTGYFAPRFPDGVCPPTADPHDPRGGTAVTSWRWSGPAAPSTPSPSSPSEEDTMPEPIDLWSYKNKDDEAAARKASGGTTGSPDAWDYLVRTYKNTAAMGATITTLAKALGDVKGIDTPALIAAVQEAIKDAVVDVDVHVTNSTNNTGS
jgi:hypothetical protein